MNERDRQLTTKIFAAYYESAEFMIPAIERREFGIGNVKKIDSRHLAFSSTAEFRKYLCTNTPFFVSHSTAYYEFPGATPIQKKQWKGADLIFDLDIHAEGKYGAYAKLNDAKRDVIRLVEDFIKRDFGCKDVTVVFSGNRGYHVHVRDSAFLSLGGEERRELVDYITGNGVNYLDFFTFSDSKPKKLLGPRPDEAGYRGRMARGTIGLLHGRPQEISRIFSKDKEREFFIGGINEGNWSKTSLKFDDLLARLRVVAETLPVGSVNTDAGVTQDLSKLIRVPNSIHGETGFVARIVKDVERFEPLRDALIASRHPTKITFIEDVPELEMADKTVGPFKKGETKELMLPLAMFFVCKESATFSFSSQSEQPLS